MKIKELKNLIKELNENMSIIKFCNDELITIAFEYNVERSKIDICSFIFDRIYFTMSELDYDNFEELQHDQNKLLKTRSYLEHLIEVSRSR